MTANDEFGARASNWLEKNAPRLNPADAQKPRERTRLAECRVFLKKMYQDGFAGLTWPKEYGGQGLTTAEQLVWNELTLHYDMASVTWPMTIALGMTGPTIVALGTEEQKRRYVPKILSGEEIWCQLFSEPGTGSDVAALQTTATRTEDGWLLNGQKVWTSGAQHSDYGAIIARTDPTVPKHHGITMFIVNMHQPGVTVRPLRVATGLSPFNEVFFDNAKVSDDAVIGEINDGWRAAVTMLNFERIAIAAGARNPAEAFDYERIAKLVTTRGLNRDEQVRRRLAEVYARDASKSAFSRYLHEDSMTGNPIGPRGSAAKLAKVEYKVWLCDVAQELFGSELVLNQAGLADLLTSVLNIAGSAAGGGSMEIQRNIVAERILGLPKDPGVDNAIPFDQIKFSR